jgi:hypothetical protein
MICWVSIVLVSVDKHEHLKVVDKRVEHLYKNTLMVAVLIVAILFLLLLPFLSYH